MTDLNSDNLRDIEDLIYEGSFDKAYQKILILEKKGSLKGSQLLKCQIFKALVLNNMGQFEESLSVAKNVLEESQKLGKHPLMIDAFTNMAESLWRLGKNEESLELIKKGQNLLEALEKKQSPSVKLREASLLYRKGAILSSLGNLDQALDYTEQSFTIRKKYGKKMDILYCLHNLGVFHLMKGDLDQALEYFKRCLPDIDSFAESKNVAKPLANISGIYAMKGELDQALRYAQRSLQVSENLGNRQDAASALIIIAEIYRQRGALDQALGCLERSLEFQQEIGNKINASESLFKLVSVAIEKNSLEQAQMYLQQLKQINDKENNKIISQRYRVAEALMLKTSIRSRNRAKAEEILEKVVEEEIVEHEVTVEALLNLCELLLIELRITNDPEVLDEIQPLVTRLLDIARRQHSHLLLIEIYLLKAKLALINLDLQETQHLLTQAQTTAEERCLERLALKISREKNLFEEQIEKWEHLIEHEGSISERLDLAQLEVLMTQIIRKRLTTTKEDILDYAEQVTQITEGWNEKE
ncbi:MAG: tetratricopeptide repeat protein [Promethearchaeota archaeon]